ncbi:ATP-binding protein [bacterium]|nr:ATP-binding protein [bacterium]
MDLKLIDLIQTVARMKVNNVFEFYVSFIQFPYFRNLEKNTKISFDFPLTVFIGQNGSGKSSTLHALYGVPKRKTPYEFWFSTAVDPVEEVSAGGDRHSFFYVYKDHIGNELEVLKLRIRKRGNPDYWETSRPVISYGMKPLKGKRNQPIEKNVVYIDFRSELSAFDKYFYFKNPSKNAALTKKQDYLRHKSKTLKKIIDEEIKIVNSRNPQNNKLKKLKREEIEWISFILGKNYKSGKFIEHKLFSDWGISIVYETDFHNYSEAFAGSGEMAAVRLVQEVVNAKDYSLILLDEPEVSLHPGAQERLKLFLLDQIKRRKLQVILSTHSPTLIDGLPKEAIKVFSQMPDGRFHVENENLPEEAFYFIGHSIQTGKKVIIVEDELAQSIIKAIINDEGEAIANLFEVTKYPGGHSIIKQNLITVYSLEQHTDKYIILDGDQKIVANHFDPDSIPERNLTNSKLKEEIKKQTNVDVKLFPDGNPATGADPDQEKQLRKKYLQFYLRNVFYLPGTTPESIIWDQAYCDHLLEPHDSNKTASAGIAAEADYKKKFMLFCEKMGLGTNILPSYQMFLNNWVKKRDNNFDLVKGVIDQIKLHNHD